MLRFLSDEDFDGNITRSVQRERPALDIVRVQDLGLSGASDSAVLEWAAQDGRIVLTHDANTMIRYAYDRVSAGQPMPGLFVVGQDVGLRQAIEEILILVDCSEEGEWQGQVLHLPL